jgi:hypothetical protein
MFMMLFQKNSYQWWEADENGIDHLDDIHLDVQTAEPLKSGGQPDNGFQAIKKN